MAPGRPEKAGLHVARSAWTAFVDGAVAIVIEAVAQHFEPTRGRGHATRSDQRGRLTRVARPARTARTGNGPRTTPTSASSAASECEIGAMIGTRARRRS